VLDLSILDVAVGTGNAQAETGPAEREKEEDERGGEGSRRGRGCIPGPEPPLHLLARGDQRVPLATRPANHGCGTPRGGLGSRARGKSFLPGHPSG